MNIDQLAAELIGRIIYASLPGVRHLEGWPTVHTKTPGGQP